LLSALLATLSGLLALLAWLLLLAAALLAALPGLLILLARLLLLLAALLSALVALLVLLAALILVLIAIVVHGVPLRREKPRIKATRWRYLRSWRVPINGAQIAKGLLAANARFAIVEKHVAGRQFLRDMFSIADAHLFIGLNWTAATPLKRDGYPAIQAYVARLAARPSIAKALGEEMAMYKAEVAQQKAA